MNKLLTRDEFRTQVFERDKHICVWCGYAGQDAHHIMERRLFEDGGYYLDNGATLCGECHILAEQTILTPEELYGACRITKRVLPPHLYEDYKYTKWGDIQNANGSRVKGELFHDPSVQKILSSVDLLCVYSPYVKYPRTYHLPFSPGTTSDDRVILSLDELLSEEVVVTVKQDGENTTCYSDGHIHARSLDSDNHPSRAWVKNFLSKIAYELPKGWRLCGENLYAVHSIVYDNLSSYFNLFSMWNDTNHCLSWEETVGYANILNIPTVPVLFQGKATKEILESLISDTYNGNECEGFVVRWAKSFHYSQFRKATAKYVRAGHVQSSEHWIKKAMKVNQLKEAPLANRVNESKGDINEPPTGPRPPAPKGQDVKGTTDDRD